MDLFFIQHKNSIKTILLFLLIFSFHLQAQEIEIQILDELDKTPIADVHVFNTSKTFTATSNARGKVVIDQSIAADEKLYFQHVAYNEGNFTLSQIRKTQNIAQLLPKETELGEIIISVGKIAEPLSEVTNKVEIIKAKEIALSNSQTSADLLQNTGNVYIQKSQMGGGSPVIRGFEANKVLMVLDGVRMNNAIYRGGHLQNAITIDPNVLEGTEVVFGPGSVIYGSDALGGVMHFMTKTPTLAKDDEKPHFEGSAMMRLASANDERTTHIDVMYGSKKWGTLSSITYGKFGDLRIGTKRTHGYEDWGKRFQYVETNAEGIDALVQNEDADVLKFTGYNQTDILQKVYFQPSENLNFSLNLQYSTSSDIPRYDRLNDPDGEGGLNYAEWKYGPQDRFLASLTTNISRDKGLYDNVNIVGAFQKIGEDRINRRFGRTVRKYREEEVKVYSLNVDFVKQINKK
ncbi:MAG: TonB-dependent receptor plug domain-containing protein, partial [Chitinophagales bacterium]